MLNFIKNIESDTSYEHHPYMHRQELRPPPSISQVRDLLFLNTNSRSHLRIIPKLSVV